MIFRSDVKLPEGTSHRHDLTSDSDVYAVGGTVDPSNGPTQAYPNTVTARIAVVLFLGDPTPCASARTAGII